MTILVVDAEQAFREAMINLLLICGVEKCEVAANAQEALEKASNTMFDVVLVNFSLPKLNGVRLGRQFRKMMPKAEVILVVDDKQDSVFRKSNPKTSFPTILKSFVNTTLPQLLIEEFHLSAQKI